MKTKCLLAFFAASMCLLSATDGATQVKALQMLVQGKKYFWEAKFDLSMQALREVISVPNAEDEYRFDAYLYMGFVLTRQNAPLSDVNHAFEQAVNIDPQREIDIAKFPPDLVERFEAVRRRLLTCVYVKAEPEVVTMVVVQNDTVVFTGNTPAEFCGIPALNYQLLVTNQGYDDEIIPLPMIPGQTDTLFVRLTPSTPVETQSIEKSGGGRSIWGWVAGGGLALAAGAVLYKTVLEGDGDQATDLPGPPARPLR